MCVLFFFFFSILIVTKSADSIGQFWRTKAGLDEL